MKRCPKCGNDTFYVPVFVAQSWLVDENGDYLETAEECSSVLDYPEDEDDWECAKCGYLAGGEAFNVKE